MNISKEITPDPWLQNSVLYIAVVIRRGQASYSLIPLGYEQ